MAYINHSTSSNSYWSIILNLYIVKYWVGFPRSEYGGVSVVIAKDEQEAATIIENHEILKWGPDYWEVGEFRDEILRKVKEAQVYELKDNIKPGVVYEFHT